MSSIKRLPEKERRRARRDFLMKDLRAPKRLGVIRNKKDKNRYESLDEEDYDYD